MYRYDKGAVCGASKAIACQGRISITPTTRSHCQMALDVFPIAFNICALEHDAISRLTHLT